MLAFGCLLAVCLLGLAVAAVGIAHQLLPRQFTTAQQRAIVNWEMERRWRSLPEGQIFPASVPYTVPASAFELSTGSGLTLTARLLGISGDTSCRSAITGAAASILAKYDCTNALRATYLDASGSMVVTVAVAVLHGSTAASAAVASLSHAEATAAAAGNRALVRVLQTYPVARTPAAGFGARQQQLWRAANAGPYVIMATAGFTDGRHKVSLASDGYVDQEMTSLEAGLVQSAGHVLGAKPRAPVCPGAPGC